MPQPRNQRFRVTLASAVIAATGLLLLAACGNSTPDNSNPGSSSPVSPGSSATASASSGPGAVSPSPSASSGSTALTIEVRATPESQAVQTTLNCDGATALSGSTVFAADAACAALQKAGTSIFLPLSTPQQCTLQAGGPQLATVTGTLQGTAVSKQFDQHNGCSIAEWQALQPLFDSPVDNEK